MMISIIAFLANYDLQWKSRKYIDILAGAERQIYTQ